MPKLNILVTGATGQQGGSLTRKLLKKGHAVRAFTRSPSSPNALELKRLGAEIFSGGFDDRSAVQNAMHGMDAVFLMGTMWEVEVEGETRQGILAADAALAAGVKHLLYTSVGAADKCTGIPHFESKYKVEEYIKKIGVPYTIIGPVWFMDNVFAAWMSGGMKEGRFALAIPPSCKLQQIAVEDIGNMAALILENRDRFLGKRFDIAGDSLTGPQTAAILTKYLGRKIDFYELPLEQVRAQSADFAVMFKWFARVGYSTDIAALRRDYPEVGWHTLEQWAKQQDWSALK